MIAMSKLAPFALVMTLCSACASAPPAPEPQAPAAPAPAAPPPAAPAAPSATAGLDLGTPEAARSTIHAVLRRGDKEAFKKCVSKRILDRQAKDFDAWFAVWKKAADERPVERFQKVELAKEDGVFKLDEN
ncbi:hypothetical protein A7982_12172 [Minicystis rosea]|nr:hypothetical protein A7982_12172 [Minicystis rosea]